jgi:hypothetical protein
MGKYLREDDVFISSSTADAETFTHSFEKSRVEVVPFTIPGLRTSYPIPAPKKGQIPFVYAGRLSVQKNLHTLLYAFRLLHDADPGLPWRFFIYGKDDNLGSPNMGMPSTRYGEWLRKLARLLELDDRVIFKGYRERAHVNRVLGERRHIAVSSSLHSDENFGMVQFRSLCRGNLAVLTRWGGYADFGKQFSDRVFLASVEETTQGPWVDPVTFAKLLGKAAETYRNDDLKQPRTLVPAYYNERRIAARIAKLATEDSSAGPRLRMTALAKRILKKQAAFDKQAPGSGRIFESYSDPDARVPFRGYRMSPKGRTPENFAPGLRCLPWVKLGSKSVRVNDPHRGNFELKFVPAERSSSVTLTDWSGASRRVSREMAERLVSLGYSHRLDTGRRS